MQSQKRLQIRIRTVTPRMEIVICRIVQRGKKKRTTKQERHKRWQTLRWEWRSSRWRVEAEKRLLPVMDRGG